MEPSCTLPWLGLSLAVCPHPHVCTRLVGRSCEQRGLCACLKVGEVHSAGLAGQKWGCMHRLDVPSYLPVRSPSGEPGRRSSSSRLHPHLLTQAGVHSLNDFRGLLFAGPSHTPAPVTICTPRPHTPPPVHEPVSSQGICLRDQTSQREHSAPYPVHMPQHTHWLSHTCAHTHLHTLLLGTNGTHLVWRDTCYLAYVPGACCDGLPQGGCDWAQIGLTRGEHRARGILTSGSGACVPGPPMAL